MKLLLLIALGLAVALSVGAQTARTDETQQPTQGAKAKTEENAKVNEGQGVKQGDRPQVNEQERVNPSAREDARVNEKVGSDTRAGARVEEKSGGVSHSTTVFRNGRETTEHLNLHRGTRERTNVHFSIGTHPRDWWLGTYSIVLMDGCHYYLADDGCWYPAYGFDPSCDYPEGVVYCD